MVTAVLALLPALAWIAYASAYLLSSRLGSWIETPDFALLEDTLARALGPSPLSKLGVLVLAGVAVRRWSFARTGSDDHAPYAGGIAGSGLLDASGVISSGLMVVALSFVKPMALSRYFVVLLPALIPWLAVQAVLVLLNLRGQAIALMTMALLAVLWWQQAFLGFGPQLGGAASRITSVLPASSLLVQPSVCHQGRGCSTSVI